jgi:hypothetical protein
MSEECNVCSLYLYECKKCKIIYCPRGCSNGKRGSKYNLQCPDCGSRCSLVKDSEMLTKLGYSNLTE